ncbi:hypothetical protein IC229_05680 [Spirosoma sp. BT702]|uniref:Uncharacterized protein n=1 Tax=Spirosoma profusum TaxID=2771354 RepID=A0A926Y1A0_9BACT|nr:hypothetical protein [Spirosoma profusum]MBD2700115.1 hypothetical protein [Spirosoma profusum]
MSQDQITEEKPEIVPVAAVRLTREEIPNRQKRTHEYHELGTLNFDQGKVRCFAHKRTGGLLFVMPDGTGYLADTATLGNQCYKYWVKTSLEPEPAIPAEETPAVESTT